MKMHQYEEDMAELTRQRLAVYRERLEDSKKELDMKINELEFRKSSMQNQYHRTKSASSSHYSTLEYTPRFNSKATTNGTSAMATTAPATTTTQNKYSKSFLSTSVENLSHSASDPEVIASHPQLLDVSFLASTPSGLPPRIPRSPRYSTINSNSMTNENSRTIYRPTPRYPSTVSTHTEHRYDTPRYRSTSYVTPNGNLSHMQGLSKSQQAILDETDKLVRDSQQFHHESASQFERARESLLSR